MPGTKLYQCPYSKGIQCAYVDPCLGCEEFAAYTRELRKQAQISAIGMREKLADLCHRQWSGWMSYLYSKCSLNSDGCLTVPPWAVARWARQMSVKYKDLPEAEKESDREEADRFLALLREQRRDDGYESQCGSTPTRATV